MSWSQPQVIMQSKTSGPVAVPLDYIGKQKAMCSQTTVLDLLWQDKKQFAFRVNEQVFNPVESIVAHKMVDLIFSEKIRVAGKAVVDLGCGSGVVGLAAIMKQAKKVLFTDINPHIQGIEEHPLFRDGDEWMVQNILADVPESSYDTVLALPPAMEVLDDKEISDDSFETGIFRHADFYTQLIADAGRVLRPGGQLVVYLRIPLPSFPTFIQLMTAAAEWFDMKSASLLTDGIESQICLENEKRFLNRWMYKTIKGGTANDGLWMFLSLIKEESA